MTGFGISAADAARAMTEALHGPLDPDRICGECRLPVVDDPIGDIPDDTGRFHRSCAEYARARGRRVAAPQPRARRRLDLVERTVRDLILAAIGIAIVSFSVLRSALGGDEVSIAVPVFGIALTMLPALLGGDDG